MNANVKVITTANFDNEVLKSDIPVLIDFWAAWCMPCKMIAPVIDQLADQHNGKVMVAKVNIDDSPEIAARYGIMSIPSIVLFKGGEKVDQMVGARPKAQFDEMINKHI